jgi:hypothetical protein
MLDNTDLSGDVSGDPLAHVELKSFLAPVLTAMEAVEKSRADGKWDMTDAQYFTPLLWKIGPAVMSAAGTFADWKSMDEDERAKVMAWVRATFKLQDTKLERKIDAVMAIAMELGVFLD